MISAVKTSLLDLPSELIREIFKYLDGRNLRRMRLNKRLDKIHLCSRFDRIHHWIKQSPNSKIQLTMLYNFAVLATHDRWTFDRMLLDLTVQTKQTELEHSFRRLASTNAVAEIGINIESAPNELNCRVVCELLKVSTTKLSVACPNYNLPTITLPHLLSLAERGCKEIKLQVYCGSLSAEDLCALRKSMFKGNLKFFKLYLMHGHEKIFVKACFGVNFDEPIENFPQVQNHYPGSQLFHNEDGFLTTVFHGDFNSEIIFMSQSWNDNLKNIQRY